MCKHYSQSTPWTSCTSVRLLKDGKRNTRYLRMWEQFRFRISGAAVEENIMRLRGAEIKSQHFFKSINLQSNDICSVASNVWTVNIFYINGVKRKRIINDLNRGPLYVYLKNCNWDTYWTYCTAWKSICLCSLVDKLMMTVSPIYLRSSWHFCTANSGYWPTDALTPCEL